MLPDVSLKIVRRASRTHFFERLQNFGSSPVLEPGSRPFFCAHTIGHGDDDTDMVVRGSDCYMERMHTRDNRIVRDRARDDGAGRHSG
jgi:hypothetical protein